LFAGIDAEIHHWRACAFRARTSAAISAQSRMPPAAVSGAGGVTGGEPSPNPARFKIALANWRSDPATAPNGLKGVMLPPYGLKDCVADEFGNLRDYGVAEGFKAL
jgi:hypothetical protein